MAVCGAVEGAAARDPRPPRVLGSSKEVQRLGPSSGADADAVGAPADAVSPVVGRRLGSGTEAWALPARAEIRACLRPRSGP